MMPDDKCPLTCKHLIIGIWGGYKCSKYGLSVSERTDRLPKILFECLRADTGGAESAKEAK